MPRGGDSSRRRNFGMPGMEAGVETRSLCSLTRACQIGVLKKQAGHPQVRGARRVYETFGLRG
jgi:hypothetical protein